MPDRPPDPDTGDDTRVRPTADRPPSTPRWVKVFGIIAIVVVLIFVVIRFTGVGGSHGPGRHTPSGNVGGQEAPLSNVTLSSVTEDYTPPGGY
ncbi:MAG TPA: hypothetical protein VF788_01950 [Pseudonocardiaceae bacterium]